MSGSTEYEKLPMKQNRKIEGTFVLNFKSLNGQSDFIFSNLLLRGDIVIFVQGSGTNKWLLCPSVCVCVSCVQDFFRPFLGKVGG